MHDLIDGTAPKVPQAALSSRKSTSPPYEKKIFYGNPMC